MFNGRNCRRYTSVTKMKRILSALLLLLSFTATYAAKTTARSELGEPDLDAIARESVDPNSKFYYPKLHKAFMANDTTMTNEEFQYFYYGTMFQEDYDPYREAPNQELLQELMPIYAKDKRTRADREKMLAYAMQVIDDNPVDLRQLTNRIYVYEQNKKYDLAKIWQFKLNRLLLVIAASGTGADPQSAYVVVYPQHEYEFINLSGLTATSQRFEAPCYDYIQVNKANANTPDGYYFNISEMLKQYFAKHPTELEDEEVSDTEATED